MDSEFHVLDYGFLVSGTWIPDYNRLQYFWIPRDEFRILKPRISYSGIQITLLEARQFLSSIIIHEQKANEFTTPNPTELFFTYHEEISVVGKV